MQEHVSSESPKKMLMRLYFNPFLVLFFQPRNFLFSSFFFSIPTSRTIQKVFYPNVPYLCVRVCVCVCVCVFLSFHCRGFSWLKQNNKYNARDQASDVELRKSFCVKYIHHHIIDNHSRDLQASNYARVSIKQGRAMRNKRQLLKISENQR